MATESKSLDRNPADLIGQAPGPCQGMPSPTKSEAPCLKEVGSKQDLLFGSLPAANLPDVIEAISQSRDERQHLPSDVSHGTN